MAAGVQVDLPAMDGAARAVAGQQGSPLLAAPEAASRSPEDSKVVKKPAKRGRKKKEDEGMFLLYLPLPAPRALSTLQS